MKLRLLTVALLGAGLLGGCALQETSAPIYDRTGMTGWQTGAVTMTGETYVVQAGDTLYSIAVRHGCNPTELARANGITDPTQVGIGTVLNITAARAAAVQNVSPTEVSQTTPATSEVTIGENVAASQTAVSLTGEAVAPAQLPLGNVMLAWPCARGTLEQKFDDAGSKGIAVAGQMGDDVKAAAAGRVLFTGDNVSAYGKLIIISHGPGAVTVYGHNSELLVKKGDQVTPGQVIAKMGNSASSTVNLLFEVRHNDKPVDPLKYLPQ